MSFQSSKGVRFSASVDFHGLDLSELYWLISRTDLQLTVLINSSEFRGDDGSCCAYFQERWDEYSLCHGKVLTLAVTSYCVLLESSLGPVSFACYDQSSTCPRPPKAAAGPG